MSHHIAARDLRIPRGQGWATFIKAGHPIPDALVPLVAAKDKRKPKPKPAVEVG